MNFQLFCVKKGRLGLGVAWVALLSPAVLAQSPLPEVSPQMSPEGIPQVIPQVSPQGSPAQLPALLVPPQNLPVGVRGDQTGTCLVSPQGSEADAAIFSTRPVFVWDGGAISRIELMDMAAGQVVWSGSPTIPVPQLLYQSTPLTPGGEYRWTIYGRDGVTLGSANFRVMTADQRAPIEAALNNLTERLNQNGRTPAEISVAVVDYLNAQGLWSDAITTSINAYPRSPVLGRYVLTIRNRICNNPIGG